MRATNTGKQDVRPEQVFTTLTNSGASTSLANDYLLPAATLTWKFADDQQLRFNALEDHCQAAVPRTDVPEVQ